MGLPRPPHLASACPRGGVCAWHGVWVPSKPRPDGGVGQTRSELVGGVGPKVPVALLPGT